MGTFSRASGRGVRCDGAGCSRQVARPTIAEAFDVARANGWHKHRTGWLPAGVAKQTVGKRRRKPRRLTSPHMWTWTYYFCPSCWSMVVRFKKKRAKAARAAVLRRRRTALERARRAEELSRVAEERARRAEEESPFELRAIPHRYTGPDICGFEWWTDDPVVQQHRCAMRAKPGIQVDPTSHDGPHRCGRCDASVKSRVDAAGRVVTWERLPRSSA